jgi:hypothetical protein
MKIEIRIRKLKRWSDWSSIYRYLYMLVTPLQTRLKLGKCADIDHHRDSKLLPVTLLCVMGSTMTLIIYNSCDSFLLWDV